jgi:hypothetical protein
MPKVHPHAEAAYRVVVLDDGSYGVEVSIAGTHPTTVSRFATEADAEAWIAEHRRRIEWQTRAGGWFTRSGGRRRSNPV